MSCSRPISLFVTDVDNTLYDWVHIWFCSFDALLSSTSEISGVSRSLLEEQIRAVHQRVGTSEYFHLLQELPILRQVHGTTDYMDLYRPAIAAFRDARASSMRVYPGVLETLARIRDSGVPVVAYTESAAFYTSLRFRWLELDGLVDVLYSPADHDHPPGLDLREIRQFPDEHYSLNKTEHRHTPAGHLKPDPAVLKAIVQEFGSSPESTLYIGDSLPKDVAMAQAVAVNDAFAAYGSAQHRPEYELLRRVSHWTNQDIDRERSMLKRPAVTPSVTLSRFSELPELFHFG
jgi:FMN phosphatase YigB (HAD superfamily)